MGFEGNFLISWRNLEPTRKQSWRDICGIGQIVSDRPLYRAEIAKILKAKGVPESTVYYQLNRGLDSGCVKELADGRIGPPQREQVKWAVLRIMERSDPAGFYGDSSSVSGYGLEKVAHEVGLPPTSIEADFYAVMHEVREKYEELGNSKDALFRYFGRKQVQPPPSAIYGPPG